MLRRDYQTSLKGSLAAQKIPSTPSIDQPFHSHLRKRNTFPLKSQTSSVYKLFASKSIQKYASTSIQETKTNSYHCLTEIICPALVVPSNGTKSSEDVVVETIITFSCSLGYQLSGSSTLQCNLNGHWNGTSPICSGVFIQRY